MKTAMTAPPPGPHATDRRGLIAYLTLSAALFILMLIHTGHEQWPSPDFFVHLAAVREFASEPLDPGHPLVTGSDPDAYFSPYTWTLALPVRLFGVDPVAMLATAALVNLLLLLTAIYRFAVAFSTRRWTPLLTLWFTLVAWGIPTWRWSGYLSFNSIGFALPHVSTFATALALFVLAASQRFMKGGSTWLLVIVGVGTPIVVISHPMTALWAAAIGTAIAVASFDRERPARAIRLLMTALAGLAVTTAWPFYPVLGLIGGAEAHAATNMYDDFFRRTFLGLLGVPALFLRDRSVREDPVFLGAILTGVVYLAGWVLESPILGRALPGLMLMLHLALADDLAARLSTRSSARVRSVAAGILASITVLGLIGTAPGLVRAVPRPLLPSRFADDPRLESLVEPYRVLTSHVERDDVVVAFPHLSLGTAAMSGHVVAPPAPAAFVRDWRERWFIQREILDSPDPQVRRDRVREHGVRWLVVPPDRAAEYRSAFQEAGIPASQVVVTDDLALIRLAAVDGAGP